MGFHIVYIWSTCEIKTYIYMYIYVFIRCFYFTCTPYVNNVGSHIVHIVRVLRFLFYFKLA